MGFNCEIHLYHNFPVRCLIMYFFQNKRHFNSLYMSVFHATPDLKVKWGEWLIIRCKNSVYVCASRVYLGDIALTVSSCWTLPTRWGHMINSVASCSTTRWRVTVSCPSWRTKTAVWSPWRGWKCAWKWGSLVSVCGRVIVRVYLYRPSSCAYRVHEGLHCPFSRIILMF